MSAPEKRPIAGIKIGERHRRDFGDLPALAESIKTEGLLQAIGITEDDELVFGERRLRACRDILSWDEIDVRVVNVTGIVAGEFAENAIRKDFTVSERIAILETMGRKAQGVRTDLGHSAELPNVEKAAEAVGFSSIRVATNARAVIRDGVPELVAAMDAGRVSIDAATRLAKLPPEEQRQIAAAPEPEIRQRARETRAPPKPGMTGPGSKGSRGTLAKMTLPMSAKPAATAILAKWPRGMICDLIEELQKRLEQRAA